MDELSTTPSSLNWSETVTILSEPLTNSTEDIHKSRNQKIVPMMQDSQQQDSEGEFSGGKLK